MDRNDIAYISQPSLNSAPFRSKTNPAKFPFAKLKEEKTNDNLLLTIRWPSKAIRRGFSGCAAARLFVAAANLNRDSVIIQGLKVE